MGGGPIIIGGGPIIMGGGPIIIGGGPIIIGYGPPTMDMLCFSWVAIIDPAVTLISPEFIMVDIWLACRIL